MILQKKKHNPDIFESIIKLAQKYHPRMIELRRYFHANPEIAHEEVKTSQKIKAELAKLKIRAESYAGTGLLGFLKGQNDTAVCGLRTDMDALPIAEKTDLPFKSKTEGKMHACGHDVHMATLLGAAMILSELKSSLEGSVKLIFQPAEEVPPGGAVEMIKSGVMKKPPVKMIFALHTDPNIPTGKIGVKDGVMMSEVLDFNLTIKGRGGHGARPHDTSDSIVIASQIINSLQAVISRNIDPTMPAVITIGEIAGGTARNVIADNVRMKGTIRGTETETVMKIKKAMEKITNCVTSANDSKYVLEYVAGFPVLINSPTANNILRETAAELFGKSSIVEMDKPSLGGEDFASYLQYSPGAMFRLGVRNSKINATYQWHTDKYNSDEDSMIYGSAILAGTVIKYLNQKGKGDQQ